jgi:WD40 repeat protein
MMNVLSSQLKEYNSVQMKSCREVRFSNGGHLFAAGGLNQGIYVFNFYTAECHPNMQCKGHAFVKGIDWFDDDSGFCSTGGDQAYFYNLQI